MAVLLDIHDILMTWNTDETLVLQQICDKLLLSSFSFDLVWGGLIGQNAALSVAGAAGNGAEYIHGIMLECEDMSLNVPLRQCIDTLSPVYLCDGLTALNTRLAEALPQKSRPSPVNMYPLTLENRCIGVLGVSVKDRYQLKPHEHALFQLTAQHTGFSLGMLRSFVAKDKAQSSLKLSAAVFDHSLEGIFITDTAGTIVSANAAATRITGYELEDLLGKNPRILKSDRHGEDFYTALWDSVYRNNQWEGEIWNKRRNGEIYPEWMSVSAIKDDQGRVQNYIGIFTDITRQKETENRLTYLAFHDKLTGLTNRDLFHNQLTMALLQAKRSQHKIAVLYIDLDNFKYVNDTFGHAKGDLLLQKVVLILKMCLRECDTLARMGGDEFTVLLQHFDNRDDIALTARRINEVLASPIRIDDQDLYISASIGVSCFPEDGDTPSVLMKHADTAMYSAKNDGRKRHHFFSRAMENYSIKRIEMEQHLRRALEQGEFRVFYQPQISLDSGRIVGAEALVRWQRTGVGLVSPDLFIPLAEETGLIIPIGEWVLREACAQCRTWQQNGWKDLRISVNLSGHQFKQINLAGIVANTLKETGLEPRFLDLELTENIAMQSVEASLKTLTTLKRSGIQISIDDFGTGYSSLSYLKQFPIDRLKIDRSFISDLASDPNNAAIIVAIIAMAHSLGLEVIAEGVETDEQLKFLNMHDCNDVQGYLLGYPVPAEEFTELLHRLLSEESALINTLHPGGSIGPNSDKALPAWRQG
ncbi:MAG: putative bifunctional diguanylate cyclase/phosphodiesterase [Methylobacter sp.]